MFPKAEKSGGPNSKKGKKAVSKNAIKTGVYSRSIVLPNEDKGVYQALVDRYMDEFKPSDMAETTMVNNLANLTWKKMRLDRYEQNSLMAEWNKLTILSDLKNEKLLHVREDLLWLEIAIAEGKQAKTSLDDLEQKYVEYETDINQLYSEKVNAEYLEKFLQEHRELSKKIIEVAGEKFRRTNVEVSELISEKAHVNGENINLLFACTDQILEYKNDIAWYRDNEGRIEAAKLQLKERRLMEKMQKTDFSRAHDELDRSFYRTLTELRKQQQWRREQNEVVVITSDQK